MRIVSAYCPHCDANRAVQCVPEGHTSSTDLNGHWYPALLLTCPVGHIVARFGVLPAEDQALDLMLHRAAEVAHEA